MKMTILLLHRSLRGIAWSASVPVRAIRRAPLHWAMGLTGVGWSLFWAIALGLVAGIPLAAALLMLVVGLLLIPFGSAELVSADGAPPAGAIAAPIPDPPIQMEGELCHAQTTIGRLGRLARAFRAAGPSCGRRGNLSGDPRSAD
jgi:hypothetical protein